MARRTRRRPERSAAPGLERQGPQRTIDSGVGDNVVVAVLQRGEGSQSGAATEFRYFHVWSLRDEKVIRLENFRERSAALKAAGLSD